MGVRLIAEVRKYAPAVLDRAERLVLLLIAENARDGTRVSRCGREFLLRGTGLGPRGLRHVFERLARHGLEVRVPIGTDARGRPLYAVPGVQASYRLPLFLGRKGDLEDPHKGDLGDRQADVADRQADVADRQADAEGPPSRQPSSRQQQRVPQHIAMIMKKTGADEGEALAVADLVAQEKHPTNLPGLLHRLATDGELGDWLERVRETATRSSEAAWRAHLRTQPACEHDVPGGHLVSPSGWVACPHERRRRGRQRAAGGRS